MVFEIGVYLIFIGLLLVGICAIESIDKKIIAKKKANRIARIKSRRSRRVVATQSNKMYNIIVKDTKKDIA